MPVASGTRPPTSPPPPRRSHRCLRRASSAVSSSRRKSRKAHFTAPSRFVGHRAPPPPHGISPLVLSCCPDQLVGRPDGARAAVALARATDLGCLRRSARRKIMSASLSDDLQEKHNVRCHHCGTVSYGAAGEGGWGQSRGWGECCGVGRAPPLRWVGVGRWRRQQPPEPLRSEPSRCLCLLLGTVLTQRAPGWPEHKCRCAPCRCARTTR
jgi:hypothetical protein